MILSRYQIIVTNKLCCLERRTYIQYELSLGQTLNATIVLLVHSVEDKTLIFGSFDRPMRNISDSIVV